MYRYANELRNIADGIERENELIRRVFKLYEDGPVSPFRREFQEALSRLKSVRLYTGGKVMLDDEEYCTWSLVSNTAYNFFCAYMGLTLDGKPALIEQLLEDYPEIVVSNNGEYQPKKALDDFAELLVRLMVEQIEYHGFAPK